MHHLVRLGPNFPKKKFFFKKFEKRQNTVFDVLAKTGACVRDICINIGVGNIAYFTLQSHSWAELQPFENFKNGLKKGRFSALVTVAPWKFRTRLPNYRTNASPTRTDSGLPSGNSVATEFRVARQTHFIKLCHFLPILRFFSHF